MCLNNDTHNKSAQKYTANKSQQGSMLVIALFVIIVFALLGLTMTRLLSSSTENVIYEVLGQRALNAARSGLEFCLARQYMNATSEDVANACTNPSDNLFANTSGIENCSYKVELATDITVTDSGGNYIYSKFTSTGSCQAGNIITSRTVYVDALVPN